MQQVPESAGNKYKKKPVLIIQVTASSYLACSWGLGQ